MTLFPGTFKLAQEEIDHVVGSERLPSFSDRPNLPYIDAIVKEVFRWENVVPAGMSSFLVLYFSVDLTISQGCPIRQPKKISIMVTVFRKAL